MDSIRILFTLLVLMSGFGAIAAPGDLDVSFGNQGVALLDVGGLSSTSAVEARSLIQQFDGKFVVAGARSFSNLDVALVRFDTNGSVDPTFGTAGVVVTPVGEHFESAHALVQQQDGKLVVAGYTIAPDSFRRNFLLIRYTSDGALDPEFGEGGIVITPIDIRSAEAHSLIQQQDGKLVAAGWMESEDGRNLCLVRYNEDGTLDQSFGEAGIVSSDVNGGNDEARALIQQSDGKLVVAGFANNGTDTDIVLARYLADGSLDATWEADGLVTTSVGAADDKAFSLLQQMDGRLVVSGLSYNGSDDDIVLVRYDEFGGLDDSFGVAGIVVSDLGSSAEQSHVLLLQKDGKLIALGYTNIGGSDDYFVARYGEDGIPDSTFGSAGVVITDISGGTDRAYDAVITNDGELVAAGYSNVDVAEISLVQYDVDGVQDASFDVDGIATARVGTTSGFGHAAALQPDGKFLVGGSAYQDGKRAFMLLRLNTNGSLDASFSEGGARFTSIGPDQDEAYAMVRQEDGKIVLAGATFDEDGFSRVGLVRYLENGSHDIDFGIGGIVTTSSYGEQYTPRAIIQQSDGKLVVAGHIVREDGSSYAFIARYNEDGSLDDSFSTGGMLVSSQLNDAYTLLQQEDGKLVVAGYGKSAGYNSVALIRLEANGNLDLGFSGGSVLTSWGDYDSEAYGLAQQADGKLVVACQTRPAGQEELCLARYNPDGSLDTDFGEHGIVVASLSGSYRIPVSVLVQEDGKLLLLGEVFQYSSRHGALLRYLNDGSLDRSFGVDGLALLNSGFWDTPRTMFFQQDGKLLIAGSTVAPTYVSVVRVEMAVNEGGSDQSAGGSSGGGVLSPSWVLMLGMFLRRRITTMRAVSTSLPAKLRSSPVTQ